MIHDIKVFDKHGNLKEIINGDELFQKLYVEKMDFTPRLSSHKNYRKGNCPYCKSEFETVRLAQITCGDKKCLREHTNKRTRDRSNIVSVERKFPCRICKVEVVTKYSKQVTCRAEACQKENNRRTNLMHMNRKKEALACQK